MATIGADRVLERLVQVSRRQHDLAHFWRASTEILTTAVPHYWVPCWYTLDPASLLITSHFHEGLGEFPEEWLQAEYVDDDLHTIRDVVLAEPGLSTLHDVTGGDPSGTTRWQENMKLGGDQELIMRLRTPDGETWGALGLYRAPGSPMFSSEERRLLLAAAPALAEGARRSLLFGEALDPDWPDGPGLVVVSGAGEVESATAAGEEWLARLPGAPEPLAVRSVAAAAREEDSADVTVHAADGGWMTLRAAPFAGEERVAVVIEPTRPARIFGLLVSAYGLTPREREVAGCVLEGASTAGIAARLTVSPQTVQQHLKSIFGKTGVRSRRELVAHAFFRHYAPRFRNNEAREAAGLAMRGNPAPGA